MAYRGPPPQPALEARKLGPARERRALLARRLSRAIVRHAARAAIEAVVAPFLEATYERYGRCVIAVSEGIHDAGGDVLAVIGVVFVVLLILEAVGVIDIFKKT